MWAVFCRLRVQLTQEVSCDEAYAREQPVRVCQIEDERSTREELIY